MSVTIKVFFDYVCPFCYLEFHALKKAMEGRDVEVELYPKELRRPPKPKVDPMHDEMRLERFEKVIKPAAEKLGVPMNLPFVSPHPYTTDAFLGFLYAEHQGKGMEYTERLFHTFYVEEQDIGEISVLRKTAEELGMDGEAFEAEIRSQKRLEELDSYKAWAESYQVESLPTMIVGEEKIVGYHEPEEYAKILDENISLGGGMHCDEDGNCGF
jgi:predicted DsbA family dithiol-disulfide isomerase